jgi:hypothetical protein
MPSKRWRGSLSSGTGTEKVSDAILEYSLTFWFLQL